MATLLFALALSVWSVVNIAIDIHSSPYRAIAEQLEAGVGGARDLDYFARLEQALNDSEILPLCVREMVRSRATITLAIVDASYRGGDDTVQKAALAKARDALRNGLRCFPRDGNLWLRLAMVEFASDGATKGVPEMLKASLAMAPSEAWILIPRISFAAQLSDSELPGVEEVLRADVHNLATHGRISEVVELYLGGGDALRATFEGAFGSLDAERVAAIGSAITTKVAERRTGK